MKNKVFLPLLLAFAAAATLVSCQKQQDWTCVCEINGDRSRHDILDQKRADAKDVCNALEEGDMKCSLSKK